jgi:hypothetical protein
MQLALIPPIPLLETISNRPYHLVLAHLCQRYPKYKETYTSFEGYKILDNGAAEGELITDPDILHGLAEDIGAQEIVLPDAMGDGLATIDMANKFPRDSRFKYMGVAQGDNPAGCARGILCDVLALPRIINKNNPWNRWRIADKLKDQIDVPIHCLGQGGWVREPALLAQLPNVRGMDTSLPYVLAHAGLPITEVGMYTGKRPDDYFNLHIPAFPGVINIEVLDDWCTPPSVSEV